MSRQTKLHQVKIDKVQKFLEMAETMMGMAAGNLSHYITLYEPQDWEESPVALLCDSYSSARQLKELLVSKIIKPTTEEVQACQPGHIVFDTMELTLVNSVLVALEQYKYELKTKYKVSFEVH